MNGSSAMCVSLASHPDPVLQYEVHDGVPTVTASNEAFEAAFGAVEGSPITAVLEQFDAVNSPAEEPPERRLRAGDPVELVVRSGGDEHVARVLAPDGDGGTIVFADRVGGPTDSVDVGEVTSAISHDLRNPLDVAGAHLEAARETKASEHFDAVAAAHDRMERIVRGVLTLARGEAALNPEPAVSVRGVAERAWRTVETDAWTLDLAGSLPTVTADADQLQRLFENLFRNSVDHGSIDATRPEGRSEERATDGERVWVGTLAGEITGVFVADDGPGIPTGEYTNVFTPGYTLDEGGTGLGLAIVDGIADAHGWSVSATESEDGGTRIEIRFGAGE